MSNPILEQYVESRAATDAAWKKLAETYPADHQTREAYPNCPEAYNLATLKTITHDLYLELRGMGASNTEIMAARRGGK
jgi:hypothetical protein